MVLGGITEFDAPTNSVVLLNVGKGNKEWREGPKMNEKRHGHAVVVCNGWVFAIGGYNGKWNLNTIEYIRVADLLEIPMESKRKHWTTSDARLSSPIFGVAAAVARNRYIVVAGGYNDAGDYLSTVGIIDSTAESGAVVKPGPSLNEARLCNGLAVTGNRLYVVGGYRSGDKLDSVEYLEFVSNKSSSDVTFSSWTVDQNLFLVEPRGYNAALSLGSNLVVAGGYTGSAWLKSIEVLDTKNNVVWSLPDMTKQRNVFSMVATSIGIVLIGGTKVDSCEVLPLITKKEQLKV